MLWKKQKKTPKTLQGPPKLKKKFFLKNTEKDPQDPPGAPQNLIKNFFWKKTEKDCLNEIGS